MSETINIVDSEKTIKKRKPLRSELFIKELFEEKSLPSEHKQATTHREVRCLNCPYVFYYFLNKKLNKCKYPYYINL